MFGIRRGVVIGAIVATLGGVGAGTALANTPSGGPTDTPTTGAPKLPVPGPRCNVVVGQPLPANFNPRLCPTVRQQDLDITVTSRENTVLGTGPINFRFGRDITVSSTLDIIQRGGDSVFVHHDALAPGDVTVDRTTCSIDISQIDHHAVLTGRTGILRRLVGVVTYNEIGQWSFPTRNFQCVLPRGLTAAQAARALNNFGRGLPTPDAFAVQVQSTGWASTVPLITTRGTFHFEAGTFHFE